MTESVPRYIVFVSYFYPPSAAVGGLRVQGLASRVAQRSNGTLRALVVTVGGDYEWSSEGDVDVLRCPDLRFRFPVRRAQLSIQVAPVRTTPLPRPVHPLKRVLRRIANDVLIPDEQMLSLLQRRRIIQEVMARTGGAIAAVVASTPPPSGLFIARSLSTASGASFVADYRDSWVENPHWTRSAWRLRLDARLQARVLKDVDIVVSAHPAVAREFPGADVILTGFDEQEASRATGEVDPGLFTLLHAGQLYGDRRDPRPVIETAKRLCDMTGVGPERLRAVFLGDDQGAASRAAQDIGLGEYSESRRSVSPLEAKSLMARAGALISLSWDQAPEHGVIPGKIFEHIATGRPTVAFGGSAETVGRLLEDSGAGVYAYSPEAAARYLEPFAKAWLQGSLRRTELTAQAVSKAGATDMLLRLIEGFDAGRQR